MVSESTEIVYRGNAEGIADALPFRLPVEGASLEILAEALQFLHFTVRPGQTRPDLIVPVPPLCCESPDTARYRRRPAVPGRRVLPRITHHHIGDTLKLPGGSLRLRPGGGSTIACPLVTPAQLRGTFPLLLEMAVIHAMALQGVPVFHGASFSSRGTAILALGQSGSGKTTLAAAVIQAGGQVVSDDSVITLRRRPGGISVQPFRRDIQARRGSRRLFPRAIASLLEPLSGAAEPKWGLRRDAAASCFADDVSLDRIWVLSLDRRLRRCRIGPLHQAEAMAALIQGSSPLYLSGRYPREREALMPVLRSLVERVPAYGVRLGRALLEDPAVELDRLLTFTG